MKTLLPKFSLAAIFLCGPLLFLPDPAPAQTVRATSAVSSSSSLQPAPIDLPTVLRLANARNLDVQIARQRLAEAQAVHESSVSQFLPWLSPGVAYRRHDNLIQDVNGNMIDVNKDAYAPGVTLNAQVDLGDAAYANLAARQNVRAATHGVEAQRQVSVLAAVLGYFDLVRDQARTGVARQALAIAQDLERQLTNAVTAGIAYQGDALRAGIQTGQAQLALRQAAEQQRVTAARLAETLHLDAAVELVARDTDLVPLALVDTNAPLDRLVAQALAQRPEFRQNQELVSAADSSRKGAVIGPLIPSVGGQVYAGGLGGGIDNGPHRFSDSEDYSAFLAWRIGPGGLFDVGRTHLARAQLAEARLTGEKIHDGIIREVVEEAVRVRSLADQLGTARKTVAIAAAAEKLAEQRKEFAVGVVLENIQTQQDLTRARNDFVTVVAEFNKAQYALQKALGTALATGAEPPAKPAK